MAEHYYKNLPSIDRWSRTITDLGAQLRPYEQYLETAIKSAKQRRPVLKWREASKEEIEEFDRRRSDRRGKRQRNRRSGAQQRQNLAPTENGYWIVLEPIPERPDEPEQTFDDFLDSDEIFDDERGGISIKKIGSDQEGRSLLLASLPKEDEKKGKRVWLKLNTYTLERQRQTLQKLENTPLQHMAPLIKLVSTNHTWPYVEPLNPFDWKILEGEERDGTEEQRKFVSIALGTPDFAILEGPPGSGKTTAICELIAQLISQRKRVLLVASTHVAVDNVVERLLEWQEQQQSHPILPVRIGRDESRITSDEVAEYTFTRLSSTVREKLDEFLRRPSSEWPPGGEQAREMLKKSLKKDKKEGESVLSRLILESANLVCGTTIGILQHPSIRKANGRSKSFQPFDYMILDEASKTTFTEFLVPALYAKRWVVVGDIKQLSPYVEDVEFADNLRNLFPSEYDKYAKAALHTFMATSQMKRKPRIGSILAIDSEEEAKVIAKEAEQRDIRILNLYGCEPRPLCVAGKVVPDAVPELLWSDLVIGSNDALQRFEHRLPSDLLYDSGNLPSLPSWERTRQAFIEARGRLRLSQEQLCWADEMAWRLIRSFELRQQRNANGCKRYEKDIEALLPKTLPASWANSYRKNGQEPCEILKKKIENIKRAAMPSIIEILQRGFEPLKGWQDKVVLTDGFLEGDLRCRMISLSYQHRMHPDISMFPREQFYEESLLRDASSIERDWSFSQYGKRAAWIQVRPQYKHQQNAGKKNENSTEVDVLMRELDAFVNWAVANPKPAKNGQIQPWEVAALTFYRGQETLLRRRLQVASGQKGNTRNFHLPKSSDRSVKITLCTVDRFQGHEADVVFLSFVKSGSVGFLDSPNRLNVGLTRAKYQLVLIGDRGYFASDWCGSELLQDLAKSKHLHSIGWEVEE